MKKTILMSMMTTSIFAQPNYILIGPPGSGKGTFSSFMVKEKKYYQICIGDIVRFHKKNNTEIGKEIAAKGNFVDDDLAYKIIRNEIEECIGNKRHFILDGFPRNIPAFEFLTNLFTEKDILSSIVFIHFNIDHQNCINRIDSRLVCFKCSNVFNSTTRKPKISMTCDQCSTPLEVREGDTAEATIKRLAYYREHTEPLIERAQPQFKIITIDANAPLEECLNRYKQL